MTEAMPAGLLPQIGADLKVSEALTGQLVAAWGLSFGGAATLYQNASANAAGDAADVAQSILVTSWNTAIAGGGVVGGAILTTAGAPYLPGVIALILVPTFLVVWVGRHHTFPAKRRSVLTD